MPGLTDATSKRGAPAAGDCPLARFVTSTAITHAATTTIRRMSAPGEIVFAVRQVPEALARDLKHGVANGRLHRGGAVVPHPDQPVLRREEADVDLGRILGDAREREAVEIVFDDVTVGDRGGLMHGVVVEPGD